MKDIKTKLKGTNIPKNMPKILDKTSNSIKDVKSVMKDQYIRQKAKITSSAEHQEQQAERPENYATENVENALYTTADTVYHKTKQFAENKIKERVSQKVKTRNESANQSTDAPNSENPITKNHNEPKTADSIGNNIPKQRTPQEQGKFKAQQQSSIKTKEQYVAQSHTPTQQPKVDMRVKTKENYIKQHTPRNAIHTPKTVVVKAYRLKQSDNKYTSTHIDDTKTSTVDVSKQQAQKYVKTKLEAKNQAEKSVQQTISNDLPTKSQEITPQTPTTNNSTQIKTKETYIKSRGKSIAPTTENPYKPKIKADYVSNVQKTNSAVSGSETRLVEKSSKFLKTKKNATNSVKHTKNTFKTGFKVKRKAAKSRKIAVKTQKQVTKQAAKQAAKRSAQLAKQSAQLIKQTTKATVKIAVKVAQAVAHAVKALISALAAMGGWAVLVVVLIIIIIVAAIAASPFGIFISDEAADTNSIPLSSIVAECNVELSTMLDNIEDSSGADRIVMEGEQADWREVIAIFAVKVAGTDDENAVDVVVIDEAKKQKLKDIFWQMNSVTSRTETISTGENTTEKVLYITINHKTKEDMINEYGFTDRQQEALATLLENSNILVLSTQSLAISDATAQDVIRNLPDGLSVERKKVVKAACSLVGKVNYFWGGKSSAIGWDSNWGKMALVTAEGSRTSGSMRPFGLDCSGFVTWAFINSGMSANSIGHGTQGQIANCTRMAWASAQPGDLAFLSDLSHVGIVAGRDTSGNILVIHCASSANNVVITTNSIFGFAARPKCY